MRKIQLKLCPNDRGYTWSNEWRRITEARYVCAKSELHDRQDYIAEIIKKRGIEAGMMLKDDIRKEWNKSGK